MPTYTYKCRSCDKEFAVEASLQEKEEGIDAGCPDCEKSEVFQTFSRVGVLGGSSAGAAGASCSASSCPSECSC